MNETPPAIILVGAQLGENIGTAARAMLNFGLRDLRLVAPRSGWCRDRARKAAAGADDVLDNHRLYATLAEAVADLNFVVATTARTRDMVKPVLTPAAAAEAVRAQAAPSGFVFGPERAGLDNDDISRADVICRVPVNPDFGSLNLAQAVLLLAYEWRTDATEAAHTPMPHTHPATHGDMGGLFAHLEAALDSAGFLDPPEKRPAMVRNIRNMLHRAQMSAQDVRTLRGILTALLRWPDGGRDAALKARADAIARGEAEDGRGD